MTPDELVLAIMATPDGRRDPYPLYSQLQAEAPIARSEMAPIWYLTRYNDCHAALRDHRLGKSDPDAPISLMPGREPRHRLSLARESMLMVNPPDHTRLRSLVAREFTPRRVERLRAQVETMCQTILDDIADAGEVDIMDALAFPLPVRVIGELLGVPEHERDAHRPLTLAAARSIEPDATAEDMRAAETASRQQTEYFNDLIERRTSQPGDDLISALIAVRDDTDRLSQSELVATSILLFAAGFETTTNLIGNGLNTLLRHPEQLAWLRENMDAMPAAVDEILRYESPVQLDMRVALEDAEVAGRRIPQGEAVITMLAAANRDPTKIDDPHSFKPQRPEIPLLSFATGIHYCLGANLARMEGQVVFTQLLQRFDTIELLDGEPAWRDRLTLRGLEHLNVRVA